MLPGYFPIFSKALVDFPMHAQMHNNEVSSSPHDQGSIAHMQMIQQILLQEALGSANCNHVVPLLSVSRAANCLGGISMIPSPVQVSILNPGACINPLALRSVPHVSSGAMSTVVSACETEKHTITRAPVLYRNSTNDRPNDIVGSKVSEQSPPDRIVASYAAAAHAAAVVNHQPVSKAAETFLSSNAISTSRSRGNRRVRTTIVDSVVRTSAPVTRADPTTASQSDQNLTGRSHAQDNSSDTVNCSTSLTAPMTSVNSSTISTEYSKPKVCRISFNPNNVGIELSGPPKRPRLTPPTMAENNTLDILSPTDLTLSIGCVDSFSVSPALNEPSQLPPELKSTISAPHTYTTAIDSSALVASIITPETTESSCPNSVYHQVSAFEKSPISSIVNSVSSVQCSTSSSDNIVLNQSGARLTTETIATESLSSLPTCHLTAEKSTEQTPSITVNSDESATIRAFSRTISSNGTLLSADPTQLAILNQLVANAQLVQSQQQQQQLAIALSAFSGHSVGAPSYTTIPNSNFFAAQSLLVPQSQYNFPWNGSEVLSWADMSSLAGSSSTAIQQHFAVQQQQQAALVSLLRQQQQQSLFNAATHQQHAIVTNAHVQAYLAALQRHMSSGSQ